MMKKRLKFLARLFGLLVLLEAVGFSADPADEMLRRQAMTALRRAATYYRNHVAVRGGYVYYYALDLKHRWAEGPAAPEQIWVQPPGTPTVGMAYLRAYDATGDRFYLNAARAAAEALVYGQLKSGGWTNLIDFNPRGRVAQYRKGGGAGRNYSSLDDGQTQAAIRLLIRVDKALDFGHPGIHEAAEFALQAVLGAQFPNGGFPQVWTGPVPPQPIVPAAYPGGDWRNEGRIKNYWDMYTLNDNVCGYMAGMLIDACRIYRDDRFMTALKKLGDFLILAQMPDPQPAWAQQYNYEMRPIWARPFEPPALAGDESQEVLETLLTIYRITGEPKYLAPIPPALAYLKRSLLPDGRIPRFFELKTNRPLYMIRRGDAYRLTYDDAALPDHYGWKVESRLAEIDRRYNTLKRSLATSESPAPVPLARAVRDVIAALDARGRWISIYRGERLVGQPGFKPGFSYLSSAVFSRNIELLSDYLIAAKIP